MPGRPMPGASAHRRTDPDHPRCCASTDWWRPSGSPSTTSTSRGSSGTPVAAPARAPIGSSSRDRSSARSSVPRCGTAAGSPRRPRPSCPMPGPRCLRTPHTAGPCRPGTRRADPDRRHRRPPSRPGWPTTVGGPRGSAASRARPPSPTSTPTHGRNSRCRRGPIDRARAYVSGDQQYELYVNGVRAGKGQAYSYPDSMYYEALDLTRLLRPGEANAVGIVSNWQGPTKGHPAGEPRGDRRARRPLPRRPPAAGDDRRDVAGGEGCLAPRHPAGPRRRPGGLHGEHRRSGTADRLAAPGLRRRHLGPGRGAGPGTHRAMDPPGAGADPHRRGAGDSRVPHHPGIGCGGG